MREIHAPFGPLTDAQWRHLAEHSVPCRWGRAAALPLRSGHRQRFAIPIVLDIVLWQLWDPIDCPVLILRGEDSDLLSRGDGRARC